MRIKTVSAWLCAAALFTFLAACSGGGGYRDDVPVSQLIASVESEAQLAENMIDASAAYISGTMELDVSQYDGYGIRMNSAGINIDEFGIFKAKDAGQAEQLKAGLEAYLQYLRDSWMDEYMPNEKPKLTNAEIKTAGNYVMYLILSDEAKALAAGVFEEELKK